MGERTAALLERLRDGPPIVTDGGTGAMLQKLGWEGPTDRACLDAPDVVKEIHRGFASAGAEWILTNTFATSLRGASVESRNTDEELDEAERIIAAGVRIAREATEGRGFVIGSLAAHRAGSVSWVSPHMRRCLHAFETSQVDAIIFETMGAQVADWALMAAATLRSAVSCPVVFSVFPDPAFSRLAVRPLDSEGPPPATLLEFFLPQTALEAVGANCGTPADVLAMHALLALTHAPVMLRPNAGKPAGTGRGLEWPETPESFYAFAQQARALGARVIGGCCGATPAHVAAISRAVAET